MTTSPFFFTANQTPPQTFAIPSVVSLTATGFATDTTAHAVNFPATVEAGSLLLLIWSNDGTATVTTPTGFTSQYNISATARGCAFKKVATGSEGGTTINVQTSTTEAGSAQIYNITNWHGVITGVISTTLISPNTGTARSAPALTSGFGSVDTLWIIAAHASATQTVSTAPANFTDLTTTAGVTGTTGGQTYSARRSLKAANLTPGNFTLSATTTVVWGRSTIAIRGIL